VGKLVNDEELSEEEAVALTAALDMTMEEILAELALDPVESDDVEEDESDDEGDDDGPIIICTTLVGAKGLSAEHVFIVGMNNGVFPP